MKRIFNLFKRSKELNFKQFSEYSAPCNKCNSEMLLFKDNELICTNENCQTVSIIK